MLFLLSLFLVILKILLHRDEALLTDQLPAPSFGQDTGNGDPSIFKNVSIGIIGAGFAGLATFNRLMELGFSKVHLFEASHRIGGRVFPLEFEGIYLQQGAEFINGKNNPMYEIAKRLRLITGEMDDDELISSDALFLSKSNCKIPVDKMAKFIEFTLDLELRYAKLALERPDLWRITVAELFEMDFSEFLKRENFTDADAKTHLESLANIYRTYYEGEWSAPANKLALHNYAQWKDGTKTFPNSSFTLNSLGYAAILDELGKSIPEEKLHLNSRVVNIDFRGLTTTLWLEHADGNHSWQWHSNFDFIIVLPDHSIQ